MTHESAGNADIESCHEEDCECKAHGTAADQLEFENRGHTNRENLLELHNSSLTTSNNSNKSDDKE